MKNKIYLLLMFLLLGLITGCKETTIDNNVDNASVYDDILSTVEDANDSGYDNVGNTDENTIPSEINSSSVNDELNNSANNANNDILDIARDINKTNNLPSSNDSDTNTSLPNTDNIIDKNVTVNSQKLKIMGRVTYDRVHVKRDGQGLDYNNITVEPAKNVIVKLIDTKGKSIAVTKTNENGEYTLNNLPKDTDVKIRVYAQLKDRGTNGWDVKVVDNTNNKAQYVIEGKMVSTGENNSRRDIHASCGWGGRRYTSTREAAPFAILGSIYQAMEKVKKADKDVKFPPLVINWSVNNIASGNGDEAGLRDGLIITSHFDGKELYILGKEDSDTDEYDDHIMIHEWGHYFESKFSRADSIGGPHGAGDYLDIRVAFGEGWGNAWSAIATDNPIYFDTMGRRQSEGFFINIESQVKENPGWYSEASVQRILYDLYDKHNDGYDTLSLGFKPMYDVLVGPQKNTPAFTSLFSFITYLKKQNPSKTTQIDDILSSENIEPIEDIYGKSIDPHQYSNINNNGAIDICTYTRYGYVNKLYNHRYIRFNIPQKGTYTISMRQNNGKRSDPDYKLYKTSPFEQVGVSENSIAGVETSTFDLEDGNYMLDISDYNNLAVACFDVTIN
jgi:hypothetical protein